MTHTTRPLLLVSLLILLCLAAGPVLHAGRAVAPIGPVKVQGGVVAGVAGGKADITTFKGIPFAAPPVG